MTEDAPASEAPVEASSETGEEAPKPKRASRSKKAATETVETEAAGEPTAEEAAKPAAKRARKPKAKTEDATGSAEPTASEAQVAQPSDESAGTIETAKPKRGWWQRTFGD